MAQQQVHIIGIGGVMMSAIARMLAARGWQVSGSDQKQSDYTRALQAEGLTVTIGHAAENLPERCDLVAYSSAIPATNPELAEARRRGWPLAKRSEVLGQVVNPARGIAVAGTHGKTSTSAVASVLLCEGGLDPTFLVGADLCQYRTNSRVGAGPWVVVEADEYDRALLALEPEVAVIGNVEFDHPDIYRDLPDLLATFDQFVHQIKPGGLLLVGADCPNASALAGRGPTDVTVQTFGHAPQADWQVSEVRPGAAGCVAFDLRDPAGASHHLTTRLYGLHNALNATAAVATAVHAGLPLPRAAELLADAHGAVRRLELLAKVRGITLLDDYGHHPTEVRETVAAAQAIGGRLRVVYQPHQYARTRALLDDYAGCFDGADATAIIDIYQARETDLSGVSAQDVARVAGAEYLGPKQAALDWLMADTSGEQVWLIMGAGDIDAEAKAVAAALRAWGEQA